MKCIIFFLLQHSLGLNTDRRQVLRVPLVLRSQPDEKFCKDCKFFKKDFFVETKYGHCSNFPFVQTDNYLVDGYKDESPTNYFYCSTARSSDRLCGPEGKYFKSKKEV